MKRGHLIRLRQITIFLAALLIGNCALAMDILLESHNSLSKRTAIFEDNEQVAYLYLTKPQMLRPDKDAIVYSRGALVDKVDWASARRGEPPLLARDVMSDRGIISHPVASEFQFRWSRDGESVALLRNGEPLAFASSKDKHGYSKAVSASTGLARVWNQKRYEELFGQ